MKPIIPRPASLVAAVALLLTSLATSPSVADDRDDQAVRSAYSRFTKTIAPGLTFTKIVDRKTPRRIFVLTVDIARPLTMDVALAGARLPARARTSRIAKRAGALAAVNGDFFTLAGAPLHAFLQDGQLVQTSTVIGVSFAVSKDEQSTTFQPPAQLTTARFGTGPPWTIDRWNDGPPGVGEIAAFTPLGGTLSPPPLAACSARLLPSAPFAPSPAGDGFEQAFTVEQRGCFEASLPTSGGVVLSAVPATGEALQVLSLVPGSGVTLRWTLGFANVWDAIGGGPVLVSDGVDVVGTCVGSGCGRNPRTGVGVRADGKLLLVVVDGRQPKWSVGATMHEFAGIFLKLGATGAMNLDGGGSSTMVVNGEVMNRPSDGEQRRVSTAVLVLPGPDPGEPS